MAKERKNNGAASDKTDAGEWPERMKLSQAAKFLGTSTSNVSNLVGSGKIATELDPLDRRIRLVKRSDLEALKRMRTGS